MTRWTFLSGKVLWEEDNNKNNEIGMNNVIVDVRANEDQMLNSLKLLVTKLLVRIEEIVDDGMPKERVKRTNIPRVKITSKRRLYRLLDEGEDDEDTYGHV
ncbi:hypothetical protein Tco_0989931 [Tanacetum coccineum]|uniref:Uncharacterized protein n=1 Tax=Tanacetum coccineum TaxID=301880 RepID=A0ABQ5EWG5_9ASTR